jgi:hypothetical protein
MSSPQDRQQARRYALSQGDLEAPLVFRNGKVGIAIDDKSPLSVGERGLKVNIDQETLKVIPGSPYQIAAVPSDPTPQPDEWYPRALGYVGW